MVGRWWVGGWAARQEAGELNQRLLSLIFEEINITTLSTITKHWCFFKTAMAGLKIQCDVCKCAMPDPKEKDEFIRESEFLPGLSQSVVLFCNCSLKTYVSFTLKKGHVIKMIFYLIIIISPFLLKIILIIRSRINSSTS